MLGGNPEFRAVAALKNQGLSPEETPEEYEAAWDDALATAEKQVAAEHDEVTEPVSYTHLDVYKRQRLGWAGALVLHQSSAPGRVHRAEVRRSHPARR